MQEAELRKYERIKEVKGKEYGGFNHAKAHYDYLSSIFNVEKSFLIADIGCGVGKFPLWVKENYPQHVVIGIDPVFINAGTENEVLFMVGDTTKIPVETVDILTAFDVLEHICEEDLEQSFEELKRVTGKMFIAKICTRPSKAKGVDGEDLHPTVKPIEWWIEQLGRYFSNIEEQDGLVICQNG